MKGWHVPALFLVRAPWFRPLQDRVFLGVDGCEGNEGISADRRAWSSSGACREILYTCTVFLLPQESTVQHLTLRQHYRPDTERMPAWLRRLWLWF